MRFVFAILILVAGCVAVDEAAGTPELSETACGADTLQQLVGQPVETHDFDPEGKPLRILPPGSAMTMDHRPDRLNVDLDEEGTIVRIWCG